MWVLYLILGLVALFIALLAVPIDLVFLVERGGESRSRARVNWLWGLLGKDIHRGEKKPEKEPKKRRRRVRPFLSAMRSKGFVRRALRFLRDLLRRVKVRDLTLDAQVGLGDPFQTGMLFALVGPATVSLTALPTASVSVRPGFDVDGFMGRFSGDVRVVPLSVIALIAGFLLSLPTLRAVYAGFKAWRK